MGEGFFFCVRVCRVGVSRCRCVGKCPGVRGTNLGAEGRMREERLDLGIEMGIGCG